jgi:hypothetical protein
MSEVEIQLDAPDSTYKVGDVVHGNVIVTIVNNHPFMHNGVILEVVGSVQLRLSDSSVGVFEALFSSIE